MLDIFKKKPKNFIISYSHGNGFGMCSIEATIFPNLKHLKEYTGCDDLIVMSITRVSKRERELFFGDYALQ